MRGLWARNWRYAVSFTAICVLVGFVDFDKLWATVRQADRYYLLLYVITSMGLPCLFAVEMGLIIRSLGYPVGRGVVARAAIHSWSIGMLTPARAGDLSLSHFLRKHIRVPVVIAIVATNRFITLTFLCCMALFTCSLLPSFVAWPVALSTLAVLGIVVGAFVASIQANVLTFWLRWTRPVLGRLPESTLREAKLLLSKPRFIFLCVSFSILRFFWGVGVNTILFKALGATINPPLMTAAISSSRVLSLVPVSFWGIGLKEPLQMAAFGQVGVSSATVVAVSILGLAWMWAIAAILPGIISDPLSCPNGDDLGTDSPAKLRSQEIDKTQTNA